jgi:hypothetical protein
LDGRSSGGPLLSHPAPPSQSSGGDDRMA